MWLSHCANLWFNSLNISSMLFKSQWVLRLLISWTMLLNVSLSLANSVRSRVVVRATCAIVLLSVQLFTWVIFLFICGSLVSCCSFWGVETNCRCCSPDSCWVVFAAFARLLVGVGSGGPPLLLCLRGGKDLVVSAMLCCPGAPS